MIVISSLSVRRGTQLLLEDSSITINPQQKVGLIGKNGCGKSTLLSLLKGELSADAGNITVPQTWQLAWVNQETPALTIPAIEYVINGDREFRQLEQELAKANENDEGHRIALLHAKLDAIQAWTIRARAASLLHGLGFHHEQIEQPVKSFSGGWRMRLNLAQALLCRSDLLLLDEPTNHLDLDAVVWLEKWLINYTGTLILISHDRDFLDPIVNKILHIEHLQLHDYTGNYSSFELQRAAKLAQQQALHRCQQEKIAHLQSYIDRFKAKASKARQAQSRIKMLERMEHITPAHVDNPFHFSFYKPDGLPNPLLKIDNVSVGYDNHLILSAIKLDLIPGSRIGLLGRNGAGKSTLIKLIAGNLPPITGNVYLSKGVKLGYFAQHQLELLDKDASPLLHMNRLSPKEPEQKMRDYLGGFGFRGSKVEENIINFSGGEKARLVLALIIWQRPNLLLLDEPTNHLDLDMRQAITEALIEFEGALIIVSHDRHLLRTTTDQFYLVNDGQVTPFDGDLDDYQLWLTQNEMTVKRNINQDEFSLLEQTNTRYQQRKEQKKRDAEFRQKTLVIRKKIEQIETDMAELSDKLGNIETLLSDNNLYESSNKAQLTEYLHQQTQLQQNIATLEMEWYALQEQLETIKAAL